MKFTVSVNCSLESISRRFDEGMRAATEVLSGEVLKSCDPFVPYYTGNLASSGRTVGTGVTWSAGYASECYYASRQFSKRKHPRATARWFEAAKSESLGEWKKAVAGVFCDGR